MRNEARDNRGARIQLRRALHVLAGLARRRPRALRARPSMALGSNLRFSSGHRSLLCAASRRFLIGVPGFEPGTSATRTQRSTGLSHTPRTTYRVTTTADGVGWTSLRDVVSLEHPVGASREHRNPSLGSTHALLRSLRGFEHF